jgi:hypothetical protein
VDRYPKSDYSVRALEVLEGKKASAEADSLRVARYKAIRDSVNAAEAVKLAQARADSIAGRTSARPDSAGAVAGPGGVSVGADSLSKKEAAGAEGERVFGPALPPEMQRERDAAEAQRRRIESLDRDPQPGGAGADSSRAPPGGTPRVHTPPDSTRAPSDTTWAPPDSTWTPAESDTTGEGAPADTSGGDAGGRSP